MTALPATSDFNAATTTEGQFKTAQSNLLGFLSGLLGTDGTVVTGLATLGALGSVYLAKTAAYTVQLADRGRIIDATTGTWTLSLPAVAGQSGFSLILRNSGTGVITIDPSGAEQVDGATTVTVTAGRAVVLICTGTAWAAHWLASASGSGPVTLTGDVTGSGTGTFATTIAANVVNNAKLAQVATATIKGRVTAGTGTAEDLTPTQAKAVLAIASGDVAGLGALATLSSVSLTTQASGTLQAAQEPAHTGDVTNSAGSLALTIAAGVVSNAKLATMAANTVKANATAGAATPSDVALAASQLLGRGAAGDIAAIVLGTNLSMTGTTLNVGSGTIALQTMAIASMRF